MLTRLLEASWSLSFRRARNHDQSFGVAFVPPRNEPVVRLESPSVASQVGYGVPRRMEAAIGVTAPFPWLRPTGRSQGPSSPRQRLDQALQARSPMTRS